MGDMERRVNCLLSCFPYVPFDTSGSCPGGESVEDMQCRVDTVIAKVRLGESDWDASRND
jgi:hypothetical protein